MSAVVIADHLARGRDGFIATVERFAAVTAADPAASAVEDQDGVVTREQLLRSAVRVGDALVDALGAGALVAVLVDRDRQLPAALLGTHAAACAYLTLDPGLPAARMRTVLDAVPVEAVIASPELQGRVPGHLPLLGTDGTWIRLPAHRSDGRFDGVAYLIHTSGSTGDPKCVQIGHETLDVHIAGTENLVGPTDGQVWQTVSPLGFDSHVTEFLVAMTGGAVMCLGPRDPLAVMSGPLLVGTRSSGPVTHMQCTPSLLRMLASDPEILARLRTMEALLVGGEPFPTELLARFAGSPVRLCNVYGPTEATVWVADHEIRGAEVGSVPIGRAIERTVLRVLGHDGHEVAVGTVGQLHIGGDSLAHGYFGDASITAERFVPDPWSTHGGRLYDTGDLAVRDRRGEITVLGRSDNQVKVRGNRVELGEVESVIRAHPDVHDVVVEPDHRPDAHTLTAVVAAATPVAVIGLRAWLSGRLAEYQIPSRFEFRSALPRTAAGKVDRRVDPRPARSALTHDDHRSTP